GRRRLPHTLRYTLVAAATLAASFLLQAYWLESRIPVGFGDGVAVPQPAEPLPASVATLARVADCAWEGRDGPGPVGSRLRPGVLRLRRGVAEIHFDRGPSLLIQGPVELRLDSETAATLVSGTVVFRTDEPTGPFDLHTPTATLVDVGTEYA